MTEALIFVTALAVGVLCGGIAIGVVAVENYVWRHYGIDLWHDRPPRHVALARARSAR